MWSTQGSLRAGRRDNCVTFRWLAAVLWASAAIQACGSDDAPPSDSGVGDGGTGGDAAVTGPAIAIGQFSVLLESPLDATAITDARTGSTTIIGTVGDKNQAEQLVWEVANETDDCKLLVPRVPFCDPTCGRAICVEDDTCEADRTLQDVGTVTLRGITTNDGAHEVTLISVRNTYQNGLVEMPYPAFAAGDVLTLTATGGPTAPFNAPFTIEVHGTQTLQVPDVDYPLESGMPLSLSWTAPDQADASHILVKLDISHHGGSKGKIECDVEDNGALTIPADMITQLMALGVAGFPSIVIMRSTEGHTQLSSGQVLLVINEYAERWVTIPGLVSCTSPDQCPTDQTCRVDKTCGPVNP